MQLLHWGMIITHLQGQNRCLAPASLKARASGLRIAEVPGSLLLCLGPQPGVSLG